MKIRADDRSGELLALCHRQQWERARQLIRQDKGTVRVVLCACVLVLCGRKLSRSNCAALLALHCWLSDRLAGLHAALCRTSKQARLTRPTPNAHPHLRDSAQVALAGFRAPQPTD